MGSYICLLVNILLTLINFANFGGADTASEVKTETLKPVIEKAVTTGSEEDSIEKYTTAAVNLRKGPSTGTKIVTTVPRGTKVLVKKDRPDWSKIEVSGETGYMASNYLSDEMPVSNETYNAYENADFNTDELSPNYSSQSYDDLIIDEYAMVANDSGRLGDVGRLYIPSSDISVALFYYELNTVADGDMAQAKSNEWDSAVYVPWHGGQPYIADHSNQEFSTLSQCHVGDNAYIKTSTCITRYTCIEATTGYNNGIDLLRWDNVKFENLTDSDFIAYTCNGNWQNIYIARFVKIDQTYF